MKLNLGLKAFIALVLLFGVTSVFAQEASSQSETIENPPLVEVHYRQDNLAPYIERQERHGFYVGVNYEPLNLRNYISAIDNQSYETLFGSNPVSLIRLSGDYKYNTAMGSFAVGLDVGQGELSSRNSGADRTLKITRYGLGLKYTLDTLMPEPYVAPYLGINFWQMGLTEKSATTENSVTTQMGYNYSVGILIQLNFIDRATAIETTHRWGLENTFLDLYATKYAKTQSQTDPNTETDFLYGAGLRLEF